MFVYLSDLLIQLIFKGEVSLVNFFFSPHPPGSLFWSQPNSTVFHL